MMKSSGPTTEPGGHDVGRYERKNKYKMYYGPERHLLAYLLYYMPTVRPACA